MTSNQTAKDSEHKRVLVLCAAANSSPKSRAFPCVDGLGLRPTRMARVRAKPAYFEAADAALDVAVEATPEAPAAMAAGTAAGTAVVTALFTVLAALAAVETADAATAAADAAIAPGTALCKAGGTAGDEPDAAGADAAGATRSRMLLPPVAPRLPEVPR
jgi:hypothetical protein